MRGHGLAGPDGAHFFCGVIADGEYEVHLRRSRLGKFLPAFAARAFCWKISGLQLLESLGTHGAGRHASGAVGSEIRAAFTVEDGFGHDRTCGISSAEEQHVEVFGHRISRSVAAVRPQQAYF